MRFPSTGSLLLIGMAVNLLATASCSKSVDTSTIGTFRMGERVQIGSMVYTVLEAQWKPALDDSGMGKAPKNRYLLVKMSITNSGGTPSAAPPFTLEDSKKQAYTEITEGVEEVANYLGVLRMIAPAQTEQGFIVFDAPIGGYALLISDGAEPGSEKFARVNLPVSLE
ncbi:MAG: DUF4352 domain-containing protein [Bryobacteraceae bacterium]|nr:DUF4352 domain-containing protein [Bryobacteraceae bacterium]